MVSSNLASTPSAILGMLNDLERNSREDSIANKRQFARISLRGEAILQTLEDVTTDVRSSRVQLRDISQAGIGFLINEPVEKGTIWRVMFIVRNLIVGQQTICIQHCRAIADNVYICGGQFCVDPALIYMLGIDPAELNRRSGADSADGDSFLPPGDTQ